MRYITISTFENQGIDNIVSKANPLELICIEDSHAGLSALAQAALKLMTEQKDTRILFCTTFLDVRKPSIMEALADGMKHFNFKFDDFKFRNPDNTIIYKPNNSILYLESLIPSRCDPDYVKLNSYRPDAVFFDQLIYIEPKAYEAARMRLRLNFQPRRKQLLMATTGQGREIQ